MQSAIKFAVIGQFVKLLKPTVETLKLHLSNEADALRLCMGKNQLKTDSTNWKKNMVKAVKVATQIVEKIERTLDDPKLMSDDAIIPKTGQEVLMVNIEMSRALAAFYTMMADAKVIDVMAKECFESFKPFLTKINVANAAALQQSVTTSEETLAKMKRSQR